MKTGVTLRGAANCGVYVDGGSFTMSGGTISGNTESIGGGGVYVFSGSFTMSGGTISGDTASAFGGGVYVSSSGRFVKRGGGTIDATNTAGKGKVIGGARTRNSAAGPGDNLDSYVSGRAGGWE
ncbi:MAG: hypothetical protein LBF60_03815, partial [Treponema sp.]|jgi:hypothetical protein|nr:hypothetical protein [Treponema sp.]